MRGGDEGLIALTHVCRDWREMFVSRSSLWTDFYRQDADKTRVYLERSKSSPIKLRIDRKDKLLPHNPLFQIIPLTSGRLKSLHIDGSPKNIPGITAHLTHPAPFLEDLSIDGGCELRPRDNPVLTTSLFNGDLSSVRELCLRSVRTELPWRNMVNLRRSRCGTRRRARSSSDTFSTSSKVLLTSAKLVSTPRPRSPALKMDDWYHWRI